MKILWVASQLEGRGGIGRVVAEGARALAERGHAVHVAGPLRSGADLAPFAGLSLDAWPPRRAKLARLLDLVPLVRRLRPDVVHLHAAAPHAGTLAALRALGRVLGAPLRVATPHSSRPRPGRALAAADLVVVPSAFAERLASQAGARRVAVVPGGVALGPEPRFDGREPAVLALGRLDRVKRLDVLVDAFAAIAPTHAAWSLWIAGDGPERAALAACAAARGVADRVRLLGFVRGDAKRDLLERAALGVLASERESFGGALLEQMERGVACIASEVEGVAALADGGRAVRVVAPGDAGALARALAALMDDADLRRELAVAGRRRAERFAWPAVAAAYEDVYRAASTC
jgi:glycosyltransferase involved in cell wall biosynthesis